MWASDQLEAGTTVFTFGFISLDLFQLSSERSIRFTTAMKLPAMAATSSITLSQANVALFYEHLAPWTENALTNNCEGLAIFSGAGP